MGKKKGQKKKGNKQAKKLQRSALPRAMISSDVGQGILANLAADGVSAAVMAVLRKIRRPVNDDSGQAQANETRRRTDR
ncbi:hypothetical protein [Neorhizobium petrolearium]|uniref:hypothetical protein n=1 Tax=Neorhizobium petrolearium TaxID=515361 RepID=UPI003F1708FE